MSVENISLFNSVLDEALERLGKKNLKLKECQYEAVKAVVVDWKDTICILHTGMESHLYTSFFPSSYWTIYFQRMRSTGDIQFFVRRSRIIPEPPFPSQGIAGSGNEIGSNSLSLIWSNYASVRKILAPCMFCADKMADQFSFWSLELNWNRMFVYNHIVIFLRTSLLYFSSL